MYHLRISVFVLGLFFITGEVFACMGGGGRSYQELKSLKIKPIEAKNII